ncbi:hypothetical protein PoB_003280700 [Plakobranchus ocellatus]|uniref:Uncharacterized protein n=1 Tax=Plakobranchus ocellatus TaxID=259542 RepID=A0AAV4AGZ9_9GAST|nr:hypothetical protein PoB_003280700 [Plakobranchus ocellatus]
MRRKLPGRPLGNNKSATLNRRFQKIRPHLIARRGYNRDANSAWVSRETRGTLFMAWVFQKSRISNIRQGRENTDDLTFEEGACDEESCHDLTGDDLKRFLQLVYAL